MKQITSSPTTSKFNETVVNNLGLGFLMKNTYLDAIDVTQKNLSWEGILNFVSKGKHNVFLKITTGVWGWLCVLITMGV